MKQQRCDPEGAWQETQLRSGWTVREDFSVQNGRRIVTTLTIRPTADVPSGGLTARFLRTIKVGQLGYGLRATHTKFFGARAAARIFGVRRVLRPRPDDRSYAELASDYAALCDAGSKRPAGDLAAKWRTPPAVIRSRINLARKNGFLTDALPRRGGGALTDKARQVLAQEVKK